MRVDKLKEEERVYVLTKSGRVGILVGMLTQIRSDGKIMRIRYEDGMESVQDLFENISPSDVDLAFSENVWKESFVNGKISIEKIKKNAINEGLHL